ncbi:MAG: hypothetical protein B0D88_03595 [Candidatus Sedimenticola endophacoides]|nr:MAG: hypothetical protein B0D88_03595 [Candidatus Sedimenticola endophacoides]
MGSQTILSDDVTRLKEILGELQQHGEIGLWILDTATGRVEWDDIVTAIAGVESAAITTPQALLRLVHPKDRHMLVGSLRDAVASGEDHHVLYRVVNNNRWVECWARPERDATGKVVRLRGFLRNISDIRNTEMALTEIEARFQRMAENSPDMLFRLTLPGGRFEYVSPASTRIFGYRPEEFIAHSGLFRERLHPEDAADFETGWKGLSEGGACPAQEYRIIHKDGTCRWISQRATLIIGDRCKPLALEGVITDITESRLAQASLERARQQATHYLEVAGVMMIALDAEGRVTLINRRGCEILGRSKQEIIGREWFSQFLRREDRERIHEVYSRLMAGELVPFEHYENAVIGGDGEARIIAWRNSLLRDESGAITGILSSGEDITEQRHSQHQLRSALENTIQAIARTVEKRDPYTAGHQQRVAELAAAIAREMRMDEERIEGLRLAGMIHDIGKIYIPAEILNRPLKLDEAEMNLVISHCDVGYDIIKEVDFPWPVADMVRQHHERLDGSGYPQGLKGEQILPESQILAVADVVEAMASHRPYRASLGLGVAFGELARGGHGAPAP